LCNFSNPGGNNEYFDVPDKTANKLETKKTLDRENPPTIPYVVIYTTNECTNRPVVGSCSEIDFTVGQYLNVTVNVSEKQTTVLIVSGIFILGGFGLKIDRGCERL
jgi:hypothetical protein